MLWTRVRWGGSGGRTDLFTCPLHIYASFSFVLHVQFCKAKSRCTVSQVVHHQHSVTVSYRSLLWFSLLRFNPSPLFPSSFPPFRQLPPSISCLPSLISCPVFFSSALNLQINDMYSFYWLLEDWSVFTERKKYNYLKTHNRSGNCWQ